MSKIGDGIATLSWRAAGQIFETTARLRGKSLKRRVLDSFTAVAQRDRTEAALQLTSAVGVGTSWVRSGAEAYDAISKSVGGEGVAYLPAVHGLYVAEGAFGAVNLARLPKQLETARADVMQALKSGSRTDEAKAVDSVRGAGGIVTGGALSISSAVWAITNRIIPYVALKHLIAQAGYTGHAVRKLAVAAVKAAMAKNPTSAQFGAQAAKELAKGAASKWAVLAGRIFAAVPLAYTALEGLNTLRTHLDPSSTDKEKHYAKIALMGSVLSTVASFVPVATAGAATGFVAFIASPAVLGTAAVIGAATWVYGTLKQHQANQARPKIA